MVVLQGVWAAKEDHKNFNEALRCSNERSGGSKNLDGRNSKENFMCFRDKNVLMLFTAIEAGLISDKAKDYLHLRRSSDGP